METHKKSCLIVDDVSVSRYTMRLVVEELGMSVTEADSVESCLAALEATQFDVILCDWHLRRETSLALIKGVRAKTARKNLVIIMCSGVENATAEKTALEAGANSFLTKPTSREKIMTELRRLNVLA